jgi:hypothetical protein
LEVVSTQSALHIVAGVVQDVVQTPSWHTSPGSHALPHVPQCDRFADVSTQELPQRSAGGMQVQLPSSQYSSAAQRLPQPPQLYSLIRVSLQNEPQEVKCLLQAQVPELQNSRLLQELPHMPQWLSLVSVSTQLPPHSVKPAPQPLSTTVLSTGAESTIMLSTGAESATALSTGAESTMLVSATLVSIPPSTTMPQRPSLHMAIAHRESGTETGWSSTDTTSSAISGSVTSSSPFANHSQRALRALPAKQ